MADMVMNTMSLNDWPRIKAILQSGEALAAVGIDAARDFSLLIQSGRASVQPDEKSASDDTLNGDLLYQQVREVMASLASVHEQLSAYSCQAENIETGGHDVLSPIEWVRSAWTSGRSVSLPRVTDVLVSGDPSPAFSPGILDVCKSILKATGWNLEHIDVGQLPFLAAGVLKTLMTLELGNGAGEESLGDPNRIEKCDSEAGSSRGNSGGNPGGNSKGKPHLDVIPTQKFAAPLRRLSLELLNSGALNGAGGDQDQDHFTPGACQDSLTEPPIRDEAQEQQCLAPKDAASAVDASGNDCRVEITHVLVDFFAKRWKWLMLPGWKTIGDVITYIPRDQFMTMTIPLHIYFSRNLSVSGRCVAVVFTRMSWRRSFATPAEKKHLVESLKPGDGCEWYSLPYISNRLICSVRSFSEAGCCDRVVIEAENAQDWNASNPTAGLVWSIPIRTVPTGSGRENYTAASNQPLASYSSASTVTPSRARQSQSNRQRETLKRRRGDDEDPEKDPEDKPKKGEPHFHLACPYYRRNPQMHPRCARSIRNCHRLKDHLYPNHGWDRCPRCHALFKPLPSGSDPREQSEYTLHTLQDPPCVMVSERDFSKGFDQDQQRVLKTRTMRKKGKDETEEKHQMEYWRLIWRTVFPDWSGQIPSHRYDYHDSIQAYTKFTTDQVGNDELFGQELLEVGVNQTVVGGVIRVVERRLQDMMRRYLAERGEPYEQPSPSRAPTLSSVPFREQPHPPQTDLVEPHSSAESLPQQRQRLLERRSRLQQEANQFKKDLEEFIKRGGVWQQPQQQQQQQQHRPQEQQPLQDRDIRHHQHGRPASAGPAFPLTPTQQQPWPAPFRPTLESSYPMSGQTSQLTPQALAGQPSQQGFPYGGSQARVVGEQAGAYFNYSRSHSSTPAATSMPNFLSQLGPALSSLQPPPLNQMQVNMLQRPVAQGYHAHSHDGVLQAPVIKVPVSRATSDSGVVISGDHPSLYSDSDFGTTNDDPFHPSYPSTGDGQDRIGNHNNYLVPGTHDPTLNHFAGHMQWQTQNLMGAAPWAGGGAGAAGPAPVTAPSQPYGVPAFPVSQDISDGVPRQNTVEVVEEVNRVFLPQEAGADVPPPRHPPNN